MKRVAAVAISLLLSGCVSYGKEVKGILKLGVPLQASVHEHRIAILDVSARNPEWQPEAALVMRLAADELVRNRLFDQVVLAGEAGGRDATLRLNAAVFDVNRVSKSDRQMWGNGAGQAQVLLEITVEETRTGDVLGGGAVGGLAHGEWPAAPPRTRARKRRASWCAFSRGIATDAARLNVSA